VEYGELYFLWYYEAFLVQVGMYQDSGLSPLLCVVIMEVIYLLYIYLYAEDLIVIDYVEQELFLKIHWHKGSLEKKA